MGQALQQHTHRNTREAIGKTKQHYRLNIIISSIARASYCFVPSAPVLLPPASMWWTRISSASWNVLVRELVNVIFTQHVN